MIIRFLAIMGVFATASCARYADHELVEKRKRTIAISYAQELRDSCTSPSRFGETEFEREQIITRISTDVATCWVNAYVELAKKNSVDLEDVFLDPQNGLIDSSMFSDQEINEKAGNCIPNAFNNAGIEHD